MPRPYADVVGQFRRGMAGGYAARGDYARAEATAQAVDPELANSYASMADRDRTRRRQQEAESANHTYAQALQGGDYEGAASVAAKIGDVEAMQGARTTQQQVTEQQRVAAWRELQGYASAIEIGRAHV